MRYAENHNIFGSVLVGTYHFDLGYDDEKESGYFDASWDWTAITHHQQWVAICASTDDPHIPIEEPRFIRDNLGAEYFEYVDRGHFSGGDKNEHEFPELVALIEMKVAAAA